MMKKFFVYLDDGSENVMKIAVPARNEDEAREYVQGNGDVIAIKDVTDRYKIDSHSVSVALLNAGFSQTEVDFMRRALVNASVID